MGMFIGPLIGLGASLLGQAFGKKPKPDPYVLESQERNRLASADASAAVQPAKDYYTTALSGDQEALKQLLGPEINTVLSQYDTAAKAATELGPRGAGRNAINLNTSTEKATAYGKALSGARSGAAGKLADIGVAEEGQQTGLKSSLLQANAQDKKRMADEENQSNESFSNFGAGLGSLLASKNGEGKSIINDVGGLFGKLFGGGGGGKGGSLTASFPYLKG